MIQDIPKIELHLHLDGSVRIQTVKELLGVSDDVINEMIAKDTCDNLDDYLEKFRLPLEVMQTRENLERIAFELTEDLERDNVIYAEVRFAPMFHTRKGLTMEEVISSVLKGLRKGKIKTNLILCMMRGEDFSTNREVIDLAYQFSHKGVCALDLAGSEAKYPVTLYKDLFMYAKERGIPFTIHAGEASSSESVRNALLMGASRIGHGIQAIYDSSLVEELCQKNILLEVCPTSNVQTRAVSSYENHPIYDLFRFGVLVHVNTDNRTVSNISLNKEYTRIMETFPFTREDFVKMNEKAIFACFLSLEEKEKLYSYFLSKL